MRIRFNGRDELEKREQNAESRDRKVGSICMNPIFVVTVAITVEEM